MSKNKKEKRADVELAVEATEDIIIHKPNAVGEHTFIIFSGDEDMLPLIKKARSYCWNVEIWAYKASIATAVEMHVKQAIKGTTVKVVHIDDHFHEIADHMPIEWNKEIPYDRTIFVRYIIKIIICPIHQIKYCLFIIAEH